MIRQLKITALLTAALLMTGCGIMKTSSEMVAGDYKSTTNWPECAVKGGLALGIPTALSSLASGGAAMVAGAMVSGLDCAIADQTPKTVHFDFGSHGLDVNDRMMLDAVAERMGKSKRIELTGYTCNIGPDQVNQHLSEHRVLAVKDYLMQKGIEESRIATSGKGKSNPVASNDEEESRMMNRRVEMRIFR
ncbi:OmpA family protein [Endozoicomonas sp.]|uniref:OmpA family protein n=1 Tax=Endozoicomonas sp. TaxID=1892382 RepID=UPI00383B2FDE